MEREEVLVKVRKETSRVLCVDYDNVKEDSSFKDDLGGDSLEALEICMAVETELNVSIPDEDFAKINTVGELVDYIVDGRLPE